jgi:hypothetical protein
MNCSEAEHFFDAYLDGELAGSLRLEFDAHRLRCGVCQQKLAMMEACEHILARDGRGPLLSDDFTDRVMDEVEQRRVITLRSRKRRIVWGTAVGVQAAAVIAFAFLWAGYWKAPAPVLPPGDPAFLPEVEDAMEGGPVALQELMRVRGEQLAAAQSNLRDEAAALAGYLSRLSIFGDYAPVSGAPSNPFDMIIPRPASDSADEREPGRDAAGSYSL